MNLALRRILASALENTAEVIANLGIRVGDTLVDCAVEVMPPKPPRKTKASATAAAEKAKEQQEPPWHGRIAW